MKMPSGVPGRHFCSCLPGTGTELQPLRCRLSPHRELEHLSTAMVETHRQLMEDMMNNRLAVSLVAASLLASGSAFAQSTTATGAVNGARAGGEVAGPVGEVVGGTVGAAVGAGLEIPNAVLSGIPREHSVVVRERVIVGEP